MTARATRPRGSEYRDQSRRSRHGQPSIGVDRTTVERARCPASLAERRGWFERFSETGAHRLLVARQDGKVIGYAASGRFRAHEAFRETVEVGISLYRAHRGRGVGTLLYRALLEQLADERVHTALAGIALPNDASVALHRTFGFLEIGTFREYAVKHGEYISSLWMQRLF